MCIYVYFKPRTSFNKIRNHTEYLLYINGIYSYKFCCRCENLTSASRRCDCICLESDVDLSFGDDDEYVDDEDDDDSSRDESL